MIIRTYKDKNLHIIIKDNEETLDKCPFNNSCLSPYIGSYNCMLCHKYIKVDFNKNYSKQFIYCKIY